MIIVNNIKAESKEYNYCLFHGDRVCCILLANLKNKKGIYCIGYRDEYTYTEKAKGLNLKKIYIS